MTTVESTFQRRPREAASGAPASRHSSSLLRLSELRGASRTGLGVAAPVAPAEVEEDTLFMPNIFLSKCCTRVTAWSFFAKG